MIFHPCASGSDDLKAAVEQLKANDRLLQYVKICANNSFDTNHYLRTIAAHIGPHLTHLQYIIVHGNYFSNEIRNEEIASIIRKKIPCLKQIQVWSCSVGICSAIAEPLLENPHIKTLELFSCEVDDEGAGIFAQILQNGQCALEELSLESNRIGNSGCAAIMNALPSNSTLEILSLCSNEIGVEGCQTIAKALQNEAVTLQELCLRGNSKIGDVGCICIADALKHNTSLTTLNLNRCSISGRGLSVMEEILQKKNYTLCDLRVGYNDNNDRFKKLLHLNRERPVEAEIRKTGMFPHWLLKNSQKGDLNSVIAVEMLLKIMSFGKNLSALFSFIQENPSFFSPN